MSEAGEGDKSTAPLLDHLIELRNRLLWCVLALALCFGVCLYFASEIFSFLVQPLVRAFPEGEGRMIYTRLYEAFFVEVKVAIFGAFVIAFPIIASQLWMFVAPGLYKNEKHAFLPFLLATPVLFTTGAALAYYVVMPTAFHWFLSFQGNVGGMSQEALPAVNDYLTLVMQFILAFGISFLLPVLLLLLERVGIVSRKQLLSARRYIIVGAFIVAAVFTPPDVISQLMLAIPLWLLYEITMIILWFGESRKKSAEPSEA